MLNGVLQVGYWKDVLEIVVRQSVSVEVMQQQAMDNKLTFAGKKSQDGKKQFIKVCCHLSIFRLSQPVPDLHTISLPAPSAETDSMQGDFQNLADSVISAICIAGIRESVVYAQIGHLLVLCCSTARMQPGETFLS